MLDTVFKDIRSWLAVPLAVKDRVIGMLTLSKNEKAYYDERHARLITTIANQAAVAIENARLYEEAEQRAREMSALLDISGAVASTLELRPLVSTILDQLKGVIDYHGASLLIIDEQGVLEIVDARAVAGITMEVGLRF
jgi:GAF domain-containing protein